MHITLTSDDRLAPQRDAAIDAFRRGELDRSLVLFDAILEHWPLEPTVTMYRATAKELQSWGVASSYVANHWKQIEALMYGGESLFSLSASPEQPPKHPKKQDMLDASAHPSGPWERCPTPTRRDASPTSSPSHDALLRYANGQSKAPSYANDALDAIDAALLADMDTLADTRPMRAIERMAEPHESIGIELPKELRIVLDLYQQGRRKAARMWAKSYLESRPATAETRAFVQMLPAELQQMLLQRPTPSAQGLVDVRRIHSHDSHGAIQKRADTPVPPSRRKHKAIFAFGVLLIIAQSAALLALWFRS